MLVEGPDGPVLRPTKTRRPYRVALDEESRAHLAAHWRRTVLGAEAAGVGIGGDSFVFSHRPDGSTPWLPNWVTKEFIRSRRVAGLAPFRLRDLRHLTATEMLSRSVPVATVSECLSHARASKTPNVYAHAIPGSDAAAARLLSEVLASASATVAVGAP